MKISNETKIGALTAIAIAMLVLGFNFLKGKSLFKSGFFLTASFTDTKHLAPSNPVFINGLQVGNVYDITPADKNISKIHVILKFNQPFNIPDNSIAVIKDNPLASASVEIQLGDSKNYLASNATIQTGESGSLLSSVSEKLGPMADQLTATFQSLDSLLRNFNSILNPSTKNNLQSVVGNLNKATASLIVSSDNLQKLLNAESGAISGSIDNLNSFTKNLSDNNQKISNTLSNLETTTANLSKVDISAITSKMQLAINKLDSAMDQLNSTNGSIGALINDKELYNRLNSTVSSLHILMDDLRVHPKRYVNISIFGKKDKGDYLTAPLVTDSTYSVNK